METIKIKMYFEAIRKITGNHVLAEKWLDNNSDKLSGKISSIEDAKQEIINLVKLITNKRYNNENK